MLHWTFGAFETVEAEIKKALDVYTQHEPTRVGIWLRCAPPGSRVRIDAGRWATLREVPIEDLHDGDQITSFNRKKASLTQKYPVRVGSRPYSGDLIAVTTANTRSETTPEHRWPISLLTTDQGFSVYLMTNGTRWRVGRCRLFMRGGADRLRLGVQARARTEQAAVWLLGTFSTEQEAAVYESYIATAYGLSERVFRPFSLTRIRPPFFNDAMTETFFGMLDADQQRERGERCLRDHQLLPEAPLWRWTGRLHEQSPTGGLNTAAANIQPDFMAVAVPPSRYGAMERHTIVSANRRHYDGPVYSLDVPPFHHYVQDGLITHNSITGVGPVIAAGLLAHKNPADDETVGRTWAFAGLDPTRTWERSQKRPWNAALKVICFHAGESFVKMQGRKTDFYGRLYAERKLYEIARNDGGELAEQAAAVLKAKKIGKDTVAYQSYSVGKLPAAHIHARARRWTVKLFLAHYHSVSYYLAHGRLPPKPYVISHLGHIDLIEPPNMDAVPGMREAWEAAR
jgi:hypothetical protein